MTSMKEFDRLLEILGSLLAPNGCPWDRCQTLDTLCTYVLEEVHELIEAIHENDDSKIVEELGDLFLNAAFFGKLGEANSRFTTEQVLHHVNEKLIRRHPHIFGDTVAPGVQDVLDLWEKVKKEEKENDSRKSLLDGIPKEYPSLAKSQKILKRIQKTIFQRTIPKHENKEDLLAEKLLALVSLATEQEIDVELALKKKLAAIEKEFRLWEEQNL